MVSTQHSRLDPDADSFGLLCDNLLKTAADHMFHGAFSPFAEEDHVIYDRKLQTNHYMDLVVRTSKLK